MNPKAAKVLDLTSSVVSQVLTLSTALAGGVVLLAAPRLEEEGIDDTSLLKIGLLLYLISILFGLWCLYKLAESPARKEEIYHEPKLLEAPDIWIPAGIQLTTFFFGTLLVAVFGWTII